MIAICTLAWNSVDVTEEWARSVDRNSGGHDIRLFVMDNGSTDDGATERCLWPLGRFWRNEVNESIYKGWNTVLREALLHRPEMIVLTNNDVVVGPGWLDAALREIRTGEKRYFLPHGDRFGTSTPEDFDREVRRRAGSPTAPRTVPARAGWCLIFPREAIEHFLPIPEELVLWHGDDVIHDRLAAAGYRCEAITDCHVYHHVSVSFYKRDDYPTIVERDKQVYARLQREAKERTPC